MRGEVHQVKLNLNKLKRLLSGTEHGEVKIVGFIKTTSTFVMREEQKLLFFRFF